MAVGGPDLAIRVPREGMVNLEEGRPRPVRGAPGYGVLDLVDPLECAGAASCGSSGGQMIAVKIKLFDDQSRTSIRVGVSIARCQKRRRSRSSGRLPASTSIASEMRRPASSRKRLTAPTRARQYRRTT